MARTLTWDELNVLVMQEKSKIGTTFVPHLLFSSLFWVLHLVLGTFLIHLQPLHKMRLVQWSFMGLKLNLLQCLFADGRHSMYLPSSSICNSSSSGQTFDFVEFIASDQIWEVLYWLTSWFMRIGWEEWEGREGTGETIGLDDNFFKKRNILCSINFTPCIYTSHS